MGFSDEVSFGYRRKSKITQPKRSCEPKLPMIDYQKRVINFGDDLELFKVVSVLIMKRVDLGGVDLAPLYESANLGPADQFVDIDAALDAADTDDAAEPAEDEPAPRRKLSDAFGLYRHPDRYGAR